MVAERTDEHRSYFEEDKEAVYFDGEAELLCKVKRYLEEPNARATIAAAGRKRSESSDYSYHRLAHEMLTAAKSEGCEPIATHT